MSNADDRSGLLTDARDGLDPLEVVAQVFVVGNELEQGLLDAFVLEAQRSDGALETVASGLGEDRLWLVFLGRSLFDELSATEDRLAQHRLAPFNKSWGPVSRFRRSGR
jgi:hypothetical protein